jgi:hypothetical protein
MSRSATSPPGENQVASLSSYPLFPARTLHVKRPKIFHLYSTSNCDHLTECSQPPLSLTMPRAHNVKGHSKPSGPAKDEHLIFVKNVPAYLATEAIPELFARYRPDRIKNVYPKSDITTVVVGFATQEKASQAQQETDGMRLESVVLRVEMYSKHRSVRYLQEARTKSQPLDATEEDYEDLEEYEENTLAEPKYVLPFARKPQEGSGPSTWAQVAGTDRKTDMMPLPPPPGVAPLADFPTPSEQRASPAPPIKVAVPRIDTARNTDNATSTLGSTDEVLPHSSTSSSTKVSSCDGDVEYTTKTDEQATTTKPDQPVRDSIFAPWESTSTSQRISHRHCRDCTFCQMRMRRGDVKPRPGS